VVWENAEVVYREAETCLEGRGKRLPFNGSCVLVLPLLWLNWMVRRTLLLMSDTIVWSCAGQGSDQGPPESQDEEAQLAWINQGHEEE
jgi:hypothetical protein